MHKATLALLLLILEPLTAAEDAIVVIGHPGLPKTDLASVQRLYLGRTVSISQQAAIPAQLPAGNPVRQRFLETILGQDEGQYTGYWLVRRYVGKGAPPRELASVDEMISYVGATPGAVAYLPAGQLPPGANVIYRR